MMKHLSMKHDDPDSMLQHTGPNQGHILPPQINNEFSSQLSDDQWKDWNQHAEKAMTPESGAIAAGVEILKKILTDRTQAKGNALSGGDFGNVDNIITVDYLNNLANFNAEKFLKLALALNAVGDSNTENKERARDLIEAFFKSNSFTDNDLDSLLRNGSAEVQINGLTPNAGDTTGTYSHILDKLLGPDRGKFNRDSASRSSDLDGVGLNKDLTKVSNDVNLRAITGHNVEISGSYVDSDQTPDIDVVIIASGRDTTIKGDLNIQNNDSSTTDAYVIASADELFLRDKWNADTHAASYANPDPININVNNASLAMTSVDDMDLVNVDISVGGSLALASLDRLAIWSTRASDKNVLSIGNGKRQEGLYLYAEEVMSVSNTVIQGHVDDIYMESKTINLTDVHFG